MPLLTKPAFGPKAAIIYITLGALIDVWTAVWYFTAGRTEPLGDTTRFWLFGLFLSGVTLMLIGFFLGQIGRAARKAEMPPAEAVKAEANNPPVMVANQQPVPSGHVLMTVPIGAQPAAPVQASMPAGVRTY